MTQPGNVDTGTDRSRAFRLVLPIVACFVMAVPVAAQSGASVSPKALSATALYGARPNVAAEPAYWTPSAVRNGAVLRPMHPAALPACERRTWDDKRRHFLLSAAFTTGGYLVFRRGIGLSRNWALVSSLGVVAAVGIAKEFHDRDHGNPPCFSRLDLLADALGMAAAAGVIIML